MGARKSRRGWGKICGVLSNQQGRRGGSQRSERVEGGWEIGDKE